MLHFSLNPRRLMLILFTFMAVQSWGRPAWSKPVDITQPDGSVLTLLMHGDEFMHFMTTIDGYSVVRDTDGFYYYAEKHEGQLRATSVVASNPDRRQPSEQTFLAGRKKMLQPEMTASQRFFKEQASHLYKEDIGGLVSSSRKAPRRLWGDRIDYSNFKGLVLLVEFSDRPFLRDDARDFFLKLTSEKYFEGYHDPSTDRFVQCDGSVRDYFRDNSLGIFDPTFDVMGPVKINFKTTDPKGNDNSYNIIKAALKAADDMVDYTQFDLDNDGAVDMVYFIFSGYGSYVQGNNPDYIWPHASDLTYYSRYYGLRHDNMKFNRYACSVEIQDLETQASQHQNLDGIGTMCHEFSHVLGLADHYDTDYEKNGQSVHPSEWDLMAGGGDTNNGLTPCGYNSYERYALGFAPMQELEMPGDYQLESFNTSNRFYRIKTGTPGEVFYVENRQKQGWDRFLPGHGMLVWRVDSTNQSVWRQNKVNCDETHSYYELVRAVPDKVTVKEQMVSASNYDCFPGRGNVLDLTFNTTPALLSWRGEEAEFDIYDIAESDGVISFTAAKYLYETDEETFEGMQVTTGDTENQNGAFCSWDLSKALIESTATDGFGHDLRVAKIMRSGSMTTSVIEKPVRCLSFKVWTGEAQIRLSLRVNKDGKWQTVNSSEGQSMTTLSRNTDGVTMRFQEPIPAGCRLQIQVLGTSNASVAYIDDMVITYGKDDQTGIENVQTDRRPSARYNLSGQRVRDGYRGLVIEGGKKFMAN